MNWTQVNKYLTDLSATDSIVGLRAASVMTCSPTDSGWLA